MNLVPYCVKEPVHQVEEGISMTEPTNARASELWDRMSSLYAAEIEQRFVPILDLAMLRTRLEPDHRVLDIGTGTGAIACRCARLVPRGSVIALDPSPKMLDIAGQRAAERGLSNIVYMEGVAEDLKIGDESIDCVIASMSLIFCPDRERATQEIARVLVPGGQLIVLAWGNRDESDIVKFQEIAGSFSPSPPPSEVTPGSMSDAQAYLGLLQGCGFNASAETEHTTFVFDTFEHAWDTLNGVSTASMDASLIEKAKRAVFEEMWGGDEGIKVFENQIRCYVATKKT